MDHALGYSRCKKHSWQGACVQHGGWLGSLLLAHIVTNSMVVPAIQQLMIACRHVVIAISLDLLNMCCEELNPGGEICLGGTCFMPTMVNPLHSCVSRLFQLSGSSFFLYDQEHTHACHVMFLDRMTLPLMCNYWACGRCTPHVFDELFIWSIKLKQCPTLGIRWLQTASWPVLLAVWWTALDAGALLVIPVLKCAILLDYDSGLRPGAAVEGSFANLGNLNFHQGSGSET